VAKQYSLTHAGYNSWLMPLNLAIGFHLVVALSVLFLPGLLKPKPKFEDIYTVNLVNIAEPVIEQSTPEPAPEPKIAPEPEVPEKVVSIAEPAPKPVVEAAPVEPVSLKPLKRKIKKEVEPPKPPDRQRDLDRLKRQALAEAARAEQLAVEEARIAAEEAERQRKLMEAQLARIKNQVRSTPAPGPQRSSSSSNALSGVEMQYYAAAQGRIKQYYTLPDFKQWDDSLQAVVSIEIARDGTIVNHYFEKHSSDPTFDQFVRKTLEAANPLPPIPPAIKGIKYELGLIFRPGSIQ
jgi:outer membrane biosynthesis protein TonB